MTCSASNHTPFVTLANGKLKRGSLDMLPSLPLDVLCEIFCFLHPTGLLVLARTSKTFRRFLLKRSTTFIWKSARQNVDSLPELPSDMSEIQYASLVFGSVCHYEGCDRKARDTLWHLRIRSCAGCRSRYQPIKANQSDEYLALCAMLGCYPEFEQLMPCGPFLNSKGNSAKGFQKHDFKTFADELRTLPLSEHQAYLDRRRQSNEVISQFASAGVAWQLEARNARIAELRNKRTARAEIIRKGLVAIGFKEEIDHFGWDRIRKHPLINNTQAMRDKACPNVLDQLREYMLGWRELRMEEQVYAPRRKDFVDAWLQFTTIAFHDAPNGCPYLPLPPNATIGFFESIDVAIRQPSSTPREVVLEQLHAAFLPACDYILEWHRTVRRELASLLPGYSVDDDDEVIHARLKLATSVFHCTAGRCRGRGRTLAYPEILSHPCFTAVTPGKGPPPNNPRGIAHQKACRMMGTGPWNCSGRVQVHPRQCVVKDILLCCGKDPRSTTAAELDKQDPKLVCLECATSRGVITMMSWHSAVQHKMAFHAEDTLKHPWFVATTPLEWTGVPGPQNLRSFPSVWGGIGDLMGHIEHQHGVASPAFGKCYALDTGINSDYLDSAMTNYV